MWRAGITVDAGYPARWNRGALIMDAFRCKQLGQQMRVRAVGRVSAVFGDRLEHFDAAHARYEYAMWMHGDEVVQ